MERGIPEGAANVPSHDVSQSGILLTTNSYVTHNSTGVQALPTHAQNYFELNINRIECKL